MRSKVGINMVKTEPPKKRLIHHSFMYNLLYHRVYASGVAIHMQSSNLGRAA